MLSIHKNFQTCNQIIIMYLTNKCIIRSFIFYIEWESNLFSPKYISNIKISEILLKFYRSIYYLWAKSMNLQWKHRVTIVKTICKFLFLKPWPVLHVDNENSRIIKVQLDLKNRTYDDLFLLEMRLLLCKHFLISWETNGTMYKSLSTPANKLLLRTIIQNDGSFNQSIISKISNVTFFNDRYTYIQSFWLTLN